MGKVNRQDINRDPKISSAMEPKFSPVQCLKDKVFPSIAHEKVSNTKEVWSFHPSRQKLLLRWLRAKKILFHSNETNCNASKENLHQN